jgi:hypothetical protein
VTGRGVPHGKVRDESCRETHVGALWPACGPCRRLNTSGNTGRHGAQKLTSCVASFYLVPQPSHPAACTPACVAYPYTHETQGRGVLRPDAFAVPSSQVLALTINSATSASLSLHRRVRLLFETEAYCLCSEFLAIPPYPAVPPNLSIFTMSASTEESDWHRFSTVRSVSLSLCAGCASDQWTSAGRRERSGQCFRDWSWRLRCGRYRALRFVRRLSSDQGLAS